jgi:hypothetical protein
LAQLSALSEAPAGASDKGRAAVSDQPEVWISALSGHAVYLAVSTPLMELQRGVLLKKNEPNLSPEGDLPSSPAIPITPDWTPILDSRCHFVPRIPSAAENGTPKQDVRPFHFVDDPAQIAWASHWIPLDKAGRTRIPQLFGILVTRRDLSDVVLFVEPWHRNLSIVQVAFLLGHGSDKTGIRGKLDLRAPIDRYARLGAEMITIRGPAGSASEWVGRYPGDERGQGVKLALIANSRDLERAIPDHHPDRRRKALHEELKLVAAEYVRADREACGAGKRSSPTVAVEERFGYTRTTAERRVRQCRLEGLLPEARGPRAWSGSPRPPGV